MHGVAWSVVQTDMSQPQRIRRDASDLMERVRSSKHNLKTSLDAGAGGERFGPTLLTPMVGIFTQLQHARADAVIHLMNEKGHLQAFSFD